MQPEGGYLFPNVFESNYLKKIIASGCCLFFGLLISAQDISFFHLSKKEGLNDNQVTAVALDKTGLLWVGTTEGLNCYDGYTVKKFSKEEYPHLQQGIINRLVCDEKNRLWIQFANSEITLLDENRKFHTVSIENSGQKIKPGYLLPYTSRGVLFLNGTALYRADAENPLLVKRLPWKEDTALQHGFARINEWDQDKLICSGDNRLCLFDVTRLKVIYSLTVPGILAAARLNDDEAIATTSGNDKLCKVNLREGRIVKVYGGLKDQHGEPMYIYPRSIYRLQGNQFIFTSAYAGVYVFDAGKETLVRHKHDPVNSRSISADNTTFLFSDSSGYFFITSNSGGLNYFNIHHYLAGLQPSFSDAATGKIFDGYINRIIQNKDGNIWLGTQNNLVEWDRRHNRAIFHHYISAGEKQLYSGEIKSLLFDDKNRLWAGSAQQGILVFNKEKKVIKNLRADTENNKLPSNLINDIKQAPTGEIWIATFSGLCTINPDNFAVTGKDSLFKQLTGAGCKIIWFRNDREAWIGTNKGAFCIDLITKKIKQYDTGNGLSDNSITGFADDAAGNIYIGTLYAGLNVLGPNGSIKIMTQADGLKSYKIDGLLRDDSGTIWIGNDNYILSYHPGERKLIAYDEGVGLSDAGLRTFACYKGIAGELFWGGEKGVSYFYPEKLQQTRFPLQLIIHTINANDTAYWLSESKHFRLPFSKNSVSLAFSAIDLYSSKNIIYQYRLEGADNSWTTTSIGKEIMYSKLQPGNYRFLLRASRDGRQWVEAKSRISITILTPWWRTFWFIISVLVIIFTAIGYYTYSRSKKIRLQKEQLEIEQAINYFASSIYQQQTVDAILWDVTKNCISRLQFEDCVIYLKDEGRNVLIQKAAWGPKTSDENKIVNPLEIPVGKGIVGAVANTGRAEIISDTSKDERYIVDDERRSAEISVPIIYNGEVLGVIDSEHPKKNFFTQRHLSILTTIASLCANKIVRAKAEQEKQQAQLELLNHQRKIAEAQLKSLRLQMNPHFLFNSLNSIQQMILAGDESNATVYLSKFSRLLRMVLAHSDRERVTLKEELETLKLYVELESLRFKESFHHQIICDETVDMDEIKIPTLLIQPFVENAIWHGLLHKEGDRSLMIKFTEDTTENIVCIVQDNGIGREASGKMNTINNHVSKGIAVAEERLKTYNEQHARKSSVLIEDLEDVSGNAAGTRVTMTLPLLN